MARYSQGGGPSVYPTRPPYNRAPSPVRAFSPGPLSEWFRRCCTPSIPDSDETRSLVSADFDYSEIPNREDTDESSSVSSSTDDDMYAGFPKNMLPALAVIYETSPGDVNRIRTHSTENGLYHDLIRRIGPHSSEKRWVVMGRNADAVNYIVNSRTQGGGGRTRIELMYAWALVVAGAVVGFGIMMIYRL